MCGLVGYAGTEPAQRHLLDAAATEAAERGPHSWGWAWLTDDGFTRQTGPGPLALAPVAANDALVIVGHSRLATSGSAPGDAPPAEEGQPILRGDVLLAHNGTVTEPSALTHEPVVVDSEALACALEEGIPLDEALGWCGDAPGALLAARHSTGILVAARWPGTARAAHPLWVLGRPEGHYVCSRPFAPGCHPLPEGVTIVG